VKVKQETMPTPQGRRVVPRITSAMKAEANRKRVRKVKVGSPPRSSSSCSSSFF